MKRKFKLGDKYIITNPEDGLYNTIGTVVYIDKYIVRIKWSEYDYTFRDFHEYKLHTNFSWLRKFTKLEKTLS